MKNHLLASGLFSVAAILAGCNQQQPEAAPVAAPAETAAASTPPVVSAKVDPTAPADLKAGLEIMQPRLLSTVDALNKIDVLPTSRYFMHPTMDKDASAEFNVKGLSSVTLSPFISDLGVSKDCYDRPEAGVVAFTWALDNGQTGKVTVDRNYVESVAVDTSAAKTLKLVVNQGNDSTTCDWFSVGFLNVKSK
ncbi:hypothetical protein J2X06_002428 [Lysobacter niastensis]|uniref:Glycosyl hydrolase family 98 putative carbohydrate-binding module domain-containing protein n=1 Tax=Lysobacter niastensis TaxID=380629 RepID=A0ABU1WCU0_9GAMM|nr:hypothetical protein [Lysobacter niastensis]MDR7135219.1 hypothetical protein [Lysobacter niastensis]